MQNTKIPKKNKKSSESSYSKKLYKFKRYGFVCTIEGSAMEAINGNIEATPRTSKKAMTKIMINKKEN